MIAAPSTAAGYGIGLMAYVMTSTLVDASSIPTARASTKVEEQAYRRSYVGRPASFAGGDCQLRSAQSDDAILIGADRPEEGLVTALAEFVGLKPGWDGEDAVAPRLDAIFDAIRFVRAAGARGLGLEPTLHVDGSVILELEDGSAGALQFGGAGTIDYAFEGVAPGNVPFDGYTVPHVIGDALRA